MSYQDFLKTKVPKAIPVGATLSDDDIHPLLHDWQNQIVRWAVKQGRAAIFADCGLGKTLMQLEWARLVAKRTLIVAPLSVARQTVREAAKIDLEVKYVRSGDDVTGDGVWATNYEMLQSFDMSVFGAVVLDESSILKNVDGATRKRLTEASAVVPFRLACTATPAPNDVAELTNHAEFLGVMSRVDMLAAYFVHDSDTGWRMKRHAVDPMFEWMSSWAVALRKPSDLGFDDSGYDLPPLSIIPEIVTYDLSPEGQLFATELGGVSGRAQVRRQTLNKRVERAIELSDDGGQWIVWCALNDEAKALASGIDGAVNVEGSWSPEKKAQALEDFQDGLVRVLITKPKIAGFGMNFQNCHRMAFVGLSDSYESYYQSIRRCYRFGQVEPVDAHIIVSDLEQQIVVNVQRKELEAAKVTDGLVKHMQKRHARVLV